MPEHDPTLIRDLEEKTRELERARATAEAAARTLEERFRTAIAAGGQLFYDWSPEAGSLEFIGDVERLVGYGAEELESGLGGWLELVHPEDRPGFESELERVVRERLPFDGKYRVRHRDGGWRLIHDHGYFVGAAPGQELRMIGIVADVTEQERAAEALRRQEELLRAVFDTLPVGVWVLDAAGTIVRGNEAGRRIWAGARYVGLERFGEYKGWWVETGERIRPEEWAAARAITRGETSLDEMIEIECFDGSRKTILNSAVPLRDEAGTITGAFIVNQDVTERRRAEAALREREEQLRLYVEHSPAAVAMFDREMRYLVASRRWVEAYRLGEAPLVGRSHYEVFPEISPRWRAVHRRCLAGAAERGEEPFERQDGTVHWLLWEVRPWRTGDGSIGGIMIFSEDLTVARRAEQEREQLRRQLQQSQKMESVARLAGGVAHDFNNMLGVILGHAEMAIESCDAGQPMHGHLLQIREASERSAALTRQLLAFARKQNLQPRTLDLNATVEGLLKLLRRLIGEHIELVWEPGAELWPVRLDPGQLDQVLANLAVNARDAIEGAGRLTIETDNLSLGPGDGRLPPALAAGDYVRLRLTDTGSGMDEATLAHLFEPFFTTKEIGRGTGLGLATVQGIVEQHGGAIRAESEPGRGAMFEILLPRSGDEPVGAGRPVAGEPAGGTETVLVVEDEEAILRLCAAVLARYGYRVLTAGAADEALRLAAGWDGPIDLLLSDVVLPGLSGAELRRRLELERPTVRTLFMSGYTADVIGERGVLGPDTLLIEKPFTPTALALKVREAIDRAG